MIAALGNIGEENWLLVSAQVCRSSVKSTPALRKLTSAVHAAVIKLGAFLERSSSEESVSQSVFLLASAQAAVAA